MTLGASVLTFSSLYPMSAFITNQPTGWRYKYVTLQTQGIRISEDNAKKGFL